MSIKKILYRCCGAVLTMALLCGCGAQSDNISSAEESTNAVTEASGLSEVDITLLSDDVSEESVNKVKDAWSRLSQVAILPDYEIAIGPSSRDEWLKSLGPGKEFRFDDVDKAVEEASVTEHSNCVTLKCDGDTWELHDFWWLETADEVYTLLYKSEKGINDLSKRIEQESEFYDEGTFRKSVSVTIVDGKTSRAANYIISLARPFHFLHEYVHNTIFYSPSEVWLLDDCREYSFKA